MSYKKLLLIAALFFTGRYLYAKSVRDYDNEIDAKTKNLQEIQETIKNKQAEKEKYLTEEKYIRAELDRIRTEMNKLQLDGEFLRRKIRKAENNLMISQKDIESAGFEKSQWMDELKAEAGLWYKEHFSYYQYFPGIIEEKLRVQALLQKKEYLTSARKRERKSMFISAQWKDAQQKLLVLMKEQEKMSEARSLVKGQKEELLKSTEGRRLVSEEEIRTLSDSAKALTSLLDGLIKEKKKTEEELLAKREFKKKRKQLPWPVPGEIVANFGKNKHPEFETYVISNGIKIKTSPGTSVLAISGGEIMYCGEFRAYGQMIIIDHGGGFYSIYGNLGEIDVDEGMKVQSNAVIGKTDNNIESVLYFEVRKDGQPEDPVLWLK